MHVAEAVAEVFGTTITQTTPVDTVEESTNDGDTRLIFAAGQAALARDNDEPQFVLEGEDGSSYVAGGVRVVKISPDGSIRIADLPAGFVAASEGWEDVDERDARGDKTTGGGPYAETADLNDYAAHRPHVEAAAAAHGFKPQSEPFKRSGDVPTHRFVPTDPKSPIHHVEVQMRGNGDSMGVKAYRKDNRGTSSGMMRMKPHQAEDSAHFIKPGGITPQSIHHSFGSAVGDASGQNKSRYTGESAMNIIEQDQSAAENWINGLSDAQAKKYANDLMRSIKIRMQHPNATNYGISTETKRMVEQKLSQFGYGDNAVATESAPEEMLLATWVAEAILPRIADKAGARDLIKSFDESSVHNDLDSMYGIAASLQKLTDITEADIPDLIDQLREAWYPVGSTAKRVGPNFPSKKPAYDNAALMRIATALSKGGAIGGIREGVAYWKPPTAAIGQHTFEACRDDLLDWVGANLIPKLGEGDSRAMAQEFDKFTAESKFGDAVEVLERYVQKAGLGDDALADMRATWGGSVNGPAPASDNPVHESMRENRRVFGESMNRIHRNVKVRRAGELDEGKVESYIGTLSGGQKTYAQAHHEWEKKRGWGQRDSGPNVNATKPKPHHHGISHAQASRIESYVYQKHLHEGGESESITIMTGPQEGVMAYAELADAAGCAVIVGERPIGGVWSAGLRTDEADSIARYLNGTRSEAQVIAEMQASNKAANYSGVIPKAPGGVPVNRPNPLPSKLSTGSKNVTYGHLAKRQKNYPSFPGMIPFRANGGTAESTDDSSVDGLDESVPGISKWSMTAPGTGAHNQNHHGYTQNTEHGEYHINAPQRRGGGYQLAFAHTSGKVNEKVGSGLWHDLGEHRSPQLAAKAARAHHTYISGGVGEGEELDQDEIDQMYEFAGEFQTQRGGPGPKGYPRYVGNKDSIRAGGEGTATDIDLRSKGDFVHIGHKTRMIPWIPLKRGVGTDSPRNVPQNSKVVPTQEELEEGEADGPMADHLHDYINNDADLNRQQHDPIRKNLMAKKAKGTYDSDKAHKLFGYLADNGAQKYHKESGDTSQPWHKHIDKATRNLAASHLRDSFEAEADLGNYDHLKPKKFQQTKMERADGRPFVGEGEGGGLDEAGDQAVKGSEAHVYSTSAEGALSGAGFQTKRISNAHFHVRPPAGRAKELSDPKKFRSEVARIVNLKSLRPADYFDEKQNDSDRHKVSIGPRHAVQMQIIGGGESGARVFHENTVGRAYATAEKRLQATGTWRKGGGMGHAFNQAHESTKVVPQVNAKKDMDAPSPGETVSGMGWDDPKHVARLKDQAQANADEQGRPYCVISSEANQQTMVIPQTVSTEDYDGEEDWNVLFTAQPSTDSDGDDDTDDADSDSGNESVDEAKKESTLSKIRAHGHEIQNSTKIKGATIAYGNRSEGGKGYYIAIPHAHTGSTPKEWSPVGEDRTYKKYVSPRIKEIESEPFVRTTNKALKAMASEEVIEAEGKKFTVVKKSSTVENGGAQDLYTVHHPDTGSILGLITHNGGQQSATTPWKAFKYDGGGTKPHTQLGAWGDGDGKGQAMAAIARAMKGDSGAMGYSQMRHPASVEGLEEVSKGAMQVGHRVKFKSHRADAYGLSDEHKDKVFTVGAVKLAGSGRKSQYVSLKEMPAQANGPQKGQAAWFQEPDFDLVNESTDESSVVILFHADKAKEVAEACKDVIPPEQLAASVDAQGVASVTIPRDAFDKVEKQLEGLVTVG